MEVSTRTLGHFALMMRGVDMSNEEVQTHMLRSEPLEDPRLIICIRYLTIQELRHTMARRAKEWRHASHSTHHTCTLLWCFQAEVYQVTPVLLRLLFVERRLFNFSLFFGSHLTAPASCFPRTTWYVTANHGFNEEVPYPTNIHLQPGGPIHLLRFM